MAVVYEETKRLVLQEKLEQLLGTDQVYYQPPETIKLKYPCIIYSPDPLYTANADNTNYISFNRYHIKHIYKRINHSLLSEFLSSFRMISHDNRMIADSMYNDDYTIYI